MTFIPKDKTAPHSCKKNDVRKMQEGADALTSLKGKVFKSKSELCEYISDKQLPFSIEDFDLSGSGTINSKIVKSTKTKGSQTEASTDTINTVICNEILGRYWLSDDTLQQYFEILNSGPLKDKGGIIINPIISHLIKNMNDVEQFLEIIDANNKIFLIIPVNNANTTDLEEGTHWSVLAFSKKSKSFFYFDSLQTLNLDDANIIKCKLQRYFKINENEPLIICKCPQQNNSYDCGIYTILITEYLVNNILKDKGISAKCTENLTFNEVNLITKRSHLAYVLNNKNAMDKDAIFSLMFQNYHNTHELDCSLNADEEVRLQTNLKSPPRSPLNEVVKNNKICDPVTPIQNSKKKPIASSQPGKLYSSQPTTNRPEKPPQSLIPKENCQTKNKLSECHKKNIKQTAKKTEVALQKKTPADNILNKKDNLLISKHCSTTPRVKVVSTRQKHLVLKTGQ